jgi:zinc protease
MVGNFKTDEVIPMLEKYIGGLPSIHRKESWRDVTPDFPKALVKVDVPVNSEPQSSVAMVWKGDFNWNYMDRLCFTMLMDILEIRCRESMREDQGGVYEVSIDGGLSKFPKSRFTIQSSWECSPENIEKLSETMIDEMSKIMKSGPQEEDMEKVKETLIRERETKVKENGFWLSLLQNHYLTGDKIMSLDAFKKSVSAVTGDDIRKVADRYINTRSYVQVDLTPAPGPKAQ